MFLVKIFDEVSSTMEVAKEAPGQSGLVVAELQTNGRGRRGREWVSKPGNFTGTFYMPCPTPLQRAGQVSFCAIIALGRALEQAWGFKDYHYKWPNDLLSHEGEKMGGILLETHEDRLLIGIGVNLLWSPENTPYPATSLSTLIPSLKADSWRALADALSQTFQNVLQTWETSGFSIIREEWLKNAMGLGHPIKVILSEGTCHEGHFQDVSPDGALLLKCIDGSEKAYYSGEVYF